MTEAPRAVSPEMREALALADDAVGVCEPNPRVGCVIVAADGRVAGRGRTQEAGAAHAEVMALRDAAARGVDVRGATVHVTLEPCSHHGRTPPCADALVAAGVGRVVIALRDPNPLVSGRGATRLAAAGIAVEWGGGGAESRELNIGFVARMTRGTPWVRVKTATSVDGRTALVNGASRWITGAAARADGHRWRARACAILTGVGTVLHDDPELTVRDVPTSRQPLRVIVDRHGDTPAAARVLAGGNALVVTAGAPRAGAWPGDVETLALPDAGGRVDLAALMRALAARGVNELHVEAGAKLNGALLEAGLVDEILHYVAPMVVGDAARGMFERAVPLETLGGNAALAWRAVDRVGADLRLISRIVRT